MSPPRLIGVKVVWTGRQNQAGTVPFLLSLTEEIPLCSEEPFWFIRGVGVNEDSDDAQCCFATREEARAGWLEATGEEWLTEEAFDEVAR